MIRLGETIPILPAVANEGEGVRETFTAAVQAAVRFTQQYVHEVGMDAITGAPENADGLFEALLALETPSMTLVAEQEPTEAELSG